MTEEKSEPPRHVAYYRQARDFALGVHPLSKYGPPLLLFFDALLCSLIISKVACKFLSPSGCIYS
jgi:alpha-1,3-mannosyltransferase